MGNCCKTIEDPDAAAVEAYFVKRKLKGPITKMFLDRWAHMAPVDIYDEWDDVR